MARIVVALLSIRTWYEKVEGVRRPFLGRASVLVFEFYGIRRPERHYCADGPWQVLDTSVFFDLYLDQDFLM